MSSTELPSKKDMMKEIVTHDELQKHKSRDSCWVVLNGKVLDVTEFLDSHPGTPEKILRRAGTDVTDIFQRIGHSDYARDLSKNYVIADFCSSTVNPTGPRIYGTVRTIMSTDSPTKQPPSGDDEHQLLLEPQSISEEKKSKIPKKSKYLKCFGSFGVYILAAMMGALALSVAAIPVNVTYLQNLTNGHPKLGEMGLGRFIIRGYMNITFAYPWRLNERSTMARITVWISYLLHQFGQIILLYQSQRDHNQKKLPWSKNYNPYNKWMFQLHGFFIGLHFIQTHLLYDGLASDVPEITALGSVVMILVVILVIEIPRRGLFFGWMKGFPYLGNEFIEIGKKYHGFVISFGLVYDFWFHPMEGTFGHLVGFFYQFLLFWQASMCYCMDHKNRYWTLLLEVTVWGHGIMTAVWQNSTSWLIFTYGFYGIFIITQFWGIPIILQIMHHHQKRQILTAIAIVLFYLTTTVLGYYYSGQITFIYSALFIPMTEYFLIIPYYIWFIVSFWFMKWVGRVVVVQGWLWWMVAVGLALVVNVGVLMSFPLWLRGEMKVYD